MLTRIKDAIHRLTGPATTPLDDAKAAGALSLRRFEAAKTHRLNSAHWADARGASLNADLISDLKTLRYRCELEESRNAHLAGVIDTHATDLVGAGHPTLQLQKVGSAATAAEQQWLDSAEDVWSEWWESPEINGVLSGADLLAMSVRQLWTNGEWLWQKVVDRSAKGPVKLRLNAIAPRRLDTPPAAYGDGSVVMGIKRNETGKPLSYWIQRGVDDAGLFGPLLEFDAIAAKDIVHFFVVTEPGQLRGVPFAATALHVIADIRDTDRHVQEAIRLAAALSVLLYTVDDRAKYLAVNESTEMEPGTISTVPPGWQPMMIEPKQPQTNYLELRNQRLAELGRPVGMPGMMVLLDSKNHNYSSARFDAQLYQRSNRRLEGSIERRAMNPLVADVLWEGELAEAIVGSRPEKIRMVWTWPVPPHVDPEKEAKAEALGMGGGTLTFKKACALRGEDWESVIEQLAHEANLFEGVGLESPFVRGIEPDDDGQGTKDDVVESISN